VGVNVFDAIRRIIGRGARTTVVRECRDCGTTLDEDSDACPHCDEGDVVRHEIP